MNIAFRDYKDLFFWSRTECTVEFVVISAVIQICCEIVADLICTFIEEAYMDVPTIDLSRILVPSHMPIHFYLNWMWVTWMMGELITWCD